MTTKTDHLRRAADAIAVGVTGGVHLDTTEGAPAYCINGALYATDLENTWILDDHLRDGRLNYVNQDGHGEITWGDDEVQDALVSAIRELDPEGMDLGYTSWGWNDRLFDKEISRDPETIQKVQSVLRRAAEILEEK